MATTDITMHVRIRRAWAIKAMIPVARLVQLVNEDAGSRFIHWWAFTIWNPQYRTERGRWRSLR